jgi:PAS domain S-box-containing protein
MVRIDLDGRVAEANPSFGNMLGSGTDPLVDRMFLDLVQSEDVDRLRDGLAALAGGGGSGEWRGACRLRHQAGDTVFARAGLALVRDPHQRPLFIIAVVEDVTEQILLEIELRHAQKLESVGRLAAGVAHEINTPIQFVGDNVTFLGSAVTDLLTLCRSYRYLCDKAMGGQLQPDDLAGLEYAEHTADLAYIRDNVPAAIAATQDGVSRVANIVRSMKAFAHPDRGERSLADINAALQSTLTVASNELKHVADVEVDLGPLPAISCFLSDLNQVFLNLLVNAAHAVADVVGDSGSRGVVRVRSFLKDDQVVIAVSDTGTGIPAAIQARIFDPFFTTKEVGRGTGQGLALARAVVVDEHGGTLTFDTEPGRGTTFYVSLPIGVAAAEQAQAA